jgi:hypothetical protein
LIEYVIAVAVFAFAAIGISRQLVVLQETFIALRKQSTVNAALTSAVAEARVLAAGLNSGDETDENGLTIRRTFTPLDLYNEKQNPIRGLSVMTIEAFYGDEPPTKVELYVARP